MIRRPLADEEDEDLGVVEGLAPNLTPLLDVLFMLLIFLVLTANVAQYALEVTVPAVPEPAGQPAASRDTVVITLLREHEGWSLDGEHLQSWPSVAAAIAASHAAKPDAAFVIAGDRATALERVVWVLSYLRSLGIKDARIVVRQE